MSFVLINVTFPECGPGFYGTPPAGSLADSGCSKCDTGTWSTAVAMSQTECNSKSSESNIIT